MADHKLDLGKTLRAIDTKDKDYYDSLSTEEKKGFAPVVLMRYMSSASDSNDEHAYHLIAMNDLVNVNFWELSKHPELLHKLMCSAAIGSERFHKWIPGLKKRNTNKIFVFLTRVYPLLNNDEFNIWVQKNSIDDFKDLLRQYGVQKDEEKELTKHFKALKDAAGVA